MSFSWGVATSAYQIEGGGRLPSIWDTFTHDGDHIVDDSTGDVACDHVNRYAEDVALMAELGVTAYRFSISWPRVERDGTGFYDRLVDALLGRGIDPVATLFHWDLPQVSQDDGGWQRRDTAQRFAEYADRMGRALGDRVRLWLTLNEPVVHLVYGHMWGIHAPGLHLFDDPFPVAHHQLLGHGLAVAALRGHTASPIGIANSYSPAVAVGPDGTPESATDADRAAALAYDALHNRLFTDPILLGRYPDLTAFAGHERLAGLIRDGDLDAIAAPIDALGVNYYNPFGAGAPSAGNPLPYDMRLLAGYPLTYFGWPVVPGALRDLLVELRERYGAALPPIHVTENGCAYDDRLGPDGSCDDADRVSYLEAHVAAVHEAVAAGVDVRGYFVWSLLDNFEWAEGFTKRFGLVHVDFATQRRTPKASYKWYRDQIARVSWDG
ncbi:MAG TPA: GH1 family beta-glucosidase [Micromonosporaceae bacterium]|nr:GH1 family beta-glucosidase [Micromonosporaceae bacterium]